MTFSYFVYENVRKITIKLNSYDVADDVLNYTFWTETQVDKIPKLLKLLKKIK
jgi:histidyl-tRNA synthetase